MGSLLTTSEPTSLAKLRQVTEHLDKLDVAETNAHKREMYLILNALTDTVFVSGKDGLIRFVNPSVYRMLGYYPEDLLGKNICNILDCTDIESKVNESIVTVATDKCGAQVPVHIYVGVMKDGGENDLIVSIVRKT